MSDLYATLKQYEKHQDLNLPATGIIKFIDGNHVDVLIRGGSSILRHVKAVGAATAAGQEVTLTWDNGNPTAYITGGMGKPADVAAFTRGPQGVQGERGADGASAFQVAVANGYVGTEAAWLASLKGPQGDTGATGATGPKGDPGIQGLPGTGANPSDAAPQPVGTSGSAGVSDAWSRADHVHQGAAAGRETLTAARTYYVRTNGSDANNGLANTSGGAFLTIQKAVDVASNLDNMGFDVTIQIADGTYNETITLKSFVGSGRITVQGNTSNAGGVIIIGFGYAAVGAISARAVLGTYVLQWMRIACGGGGAAVRVSGGASYIQVGNLQFGNTGTTTLYCLHTVDGGMVEVIGNLQINAGSYQYYILNNGGMVRAGGVLTFSGAVTISNAFISSGRAGMVLAVHTFSGTFTGKRFEALGNGVIDTGTGNLSLFPGTIAGTTASGGQYL